MPILFYGLVLMGAIVVAFMIFILTMTGCFSHHIGISYPGQSVPASARETISAPILNLKPYSASIFTYKKGIGDKEASFQTECVVCLSGFEDEECVRQLPHCKHCFHAQCIDMWLFSHSICPVCRTPVNRLESHNSGLLIDENSMEALIHISTPS